MSELQWYQPQAGNWASREARHLYGVVHRLPAGDFEAFHIEALFARPASLGCADSLEDAMALCQQHNDTPRPSAA
jgi:hypothetical protein